MSDPRDDLAALLMVAIGGTYTAKATVPVVVDAILARWRLVPVEEPCRCIAGNEHYKSDHAAQHRAADELSQHDQAAGIYDDCKPCTDIRTAMLDLHQRGFSDRQIAERLGMSTRTIANRRRKMGLQYNDGKAIRTDQHGPHED
jgi:DNA-binding NtrC family response regulator